MKRKALSILLSVALSFTILPITNYNIYAQDPIKITVNGSELKTDVAPAIVKNRTLVPIAFIAEALNAKTEWNGKAKEVTITKDTNKIVLKINSQDAYINGEKTLLDVPAMAINNRTFVPVAFIAKGFGAGVKWDGATKTVSITDTPTENKPEQKEKTIKTVPEIQKGQGTIKGNIKSKIYHVPGGASYNKLSEKNTVYFETEKEAQEAGYRRAKR